MLARMEWTGDEPIEPRIRLFCERTYWDTGTEIALWCLGCVPLVAMVIGFTGS